MANSPLANQPESAKPPAALGRSALVSLAAPKPLVVTFDTEASQIIGLYYFLQASPDLKHWTNLASFPANGASARYTNRASAPVQYFRAGWAFK